MSRSTTKAGVSISETCMHTAYNHGGEYGIVEQAAQNIVQVVLVGFQKTDGLPAADLLARPKLMRYSETGCSRRPMARTICSQWLVCSSSCLRPAGVSR